ncbi:FecR family protein [Halosquirtibacter laminarini]|uniref:FecR family protein n=1 Tax=Halosquirtibacter laminarini TaxID=3374600 RepID=A0AC61NIA2_9BACT|nr:FecR family protein [Prolixibacteraceae bacterium]
MRNGKNNRTNDCDPFNVQDFPDIKVTYAETPEEIWARISQRIGSAESTAQSPPKMISMRILYWAASILLIVGASWGSFRFTRTVTITGDPVVVSLPDGSTVFAKNNSKVSYKPLGWYLSRELNFQGEGFFKVKKGSRFTVRSNMGMTQVLGTSFNILAVDNTFEVSCFTGRVAVTTNDREKVVVLHPKDSMIKLGEKKAKVIKQNKDLMDEPSWLVKKFTFHQRSIYYIVKYLEIEYNVKIDVPEDLDLKSTLVFDRPESIKSALNLVCKPLGLSFVEKNLDHFVLTKSIDAIQ